MQTIKKLALIAGITTFTLAPCLAEVSEKPLHEEEVSQEVVLSKADMVEQLIENNQLPQVADKQEMYKSVDQVGAQEVEQVDSNNVDTTIVALPVRYAEVIALEDLDQLLKSLVVLIDMDFSRKMVVVDVDFHRDEARVIDSLLLRYAYNPEVAGQLLGTLANRYMDEYGDEVMLSLLKGFKVDDAEMLVVAMRPYLQKALMNEILNAIHRCILHKGMKLNEIMK